MPKRLWMVGLSSLLAAACSSSPATEPPLAPCTAASGGQVSLGIAAYAAVDPTQTAGCAVFPANASGAQIDYLLVPQAVNGVPDDSSRFLLGGAGAGNSAGPVGPAAGRAAHLRRPTGGRRPSGVQGLWQPRLHFASHCGRFRQEGRRAHRRVL